MTPSWHLFIEPVETARPLEPPELLLAFPPESGRILFETGVDSIPGAGWGCPLPTGPSSRQGAPSRSGWSIAAAQPTAWLQGGDGRYTLTSPHTGQRSGADPFLLLEEVLGNRWRHPSPSPAPSPHRPPFVGGFAGFLSFDFGRELLGLPHRTRPELPLPQVYLAFYDTVIALHHPTGRLWIAGCCPPDRTGVIRSRIHRLRSALQEMALRAPDPLPGAAPVGPIRSSFSPESYARAVRQVLEALGAGRMRQLNLAQRFTCALDPRWGPRPGWTVYRRLRSRNRAPFACYLEGPGFEAVSASPERFLSVYPDERGLWKAQTRPIKGTRPRASSPDEDARQAGALLASEKDRLELAITMELVLEEMRSLGGADRVTVVQERALESYATVHHTVGTVEATLEAGTDRRALFHTLFPGASVTGAPKRRVLEMIAALEPVPRHLYCGGLGFLSWDGNMEFNVAIRTMTVAAGQAFFHGGGGIVPGSDPESEYYETIVKTRALAAALGVKNFAGAPGEESGAAS